MFPEIILASQSPRRQQLLQQLDLPFKVVVADIDERAPEGMPLYKVAEHLAYEKAARVFHNHPKALVIAADTLVLLENELLGKPVDPNDAKRLLLKLSGRMHEVVSGVCIMSAERVKSFTCTTEVYFNELSSDQIAHYIQTHMPLDKAGAYAIQEYIGLVGIREIRGDYYNVMGLPVSRVVQELQAFNLNI